MSGHHETNLHLFLDIFAQFDRYGKKPWRYADYAKATSVNLYFPKVAC
jgi:hypothetical protein